MTFVDRLLTIVITATLTSAVWIVAGGSLIENADSPGQREVTRPSEALPSPAAGADNASAEVPLDEADEVSGQESAPAVLASAQQTSEDAEAKAPTGTASNAPSLNTQSAGSQPEAETRNLLIPVLNIRAEDLSDTFRSSSEGANGVLHEALDIMAPVGTSVIAAAPGVVERLYRSRSGGNTIYLRSGDRETIHYYAHLDSYAPGLKEGQRIRRGQRLGTVGSTGNASNKTPHLHFAILQTTKDAEWWEPANAVNPYDLLANQ